MQLKTFFLALPVAVLAYSAVDENVDQIPKIVVSNANNNQVSQISKRHYNEMSRLFKRDNNGCPTGYSACSDGGCCQPGTVCGHLASNNKPYCCESTNDSGCIADSADSASATTTSAAATTSGVELACPTGYDSCPEELGGGCCKPGENCYVSLQGTGKCSAICTGEAVSCAWGGCCPEGFTCNATLQGCQQAANATLPDTTTASPTTTVSPTTANPATTVPTSSSASSSTATAPNSCTTTQIVLPTDNCEGEVSPTSTAVPSSTTSLPVYTGSADKLVSNAGLLLAGPIALLHFI